jgi:hypothetical protein
MLIKVWFNAILNNFLTGLVQIEKKKPDMRMPGSNDNEFNVRMKAIQ